MLFFYVDGVVCAAHAYTDNKNQILNTYMHKYRQIYTNNGLQNLYLGNRRNVKKVLS